MQLRPLILVGAALSLAAGVAMARALITHDGVGVMEYVTGAAIVAFTVLTAFRLARRAIARA